MGHSILVIDDETTLARNIAVYLTNEGFETHVAHDGKTGLAAFEKVDPDIVLLDLRLPDASGLDLLRAMREASAETIIVMMTAFGDIETAVNAMKTGATDFLRKPLALLEVKRLIDIALERERKTAALVRMSGDPWLSEIIGVSPPMQDLKRQIVQLCSAERGLTEGGPPVLIVGETGTGKELVAGAIHRGGARAEGPFIEVNCAAIPGEIVESELFGHERGAFTDARERKIGLIEAADGGTLFLDEIGEMTLSSQAKILKVMEDRMVRRVGGTRARAVDVRFIAATNRRLEDLVAHGDFRRDLLYRLSVARFNLPPLRDRGEDILLLAERFLSVLNVRYNRPRLAIPPEAAARLREHTWPGNVRELRNLLERATLFNVGDELNIGPMDLQIPGGGASEAINSAPFAANAVQSSDDLKRLELELISRALREAGGNVAKAARRLNISRDQLRYRMAKHNLPRET